METEMEHKYREVLPCGVLTTPTGKKFWLLSPYPVVKDWETDELYRFAVVPYAHIGKSGKTFRYSFARHLITPAPEIEYVYGLEPIYIRDLEEMDLRNLPKEVSSGNEEPNWFDESLKLAKESVVSVGD